MVTKVRSFKQTQLMDKNFEQDVANTSGLTFGYFGGNIKGGGSYVSIPAGTVVLPSNSAWYLYVDASTIPATVESSTTAPSSGALLLYSGTTSSSAITTINDLRSWSGAGDGTGLSVSSTSMYDYMVTLSPEHWWPMWEAQSPCYDYGTGSNAGLGSPGTVNWLMSEGGSPIFHADGPVSTIPCVDFSGTNQWLTEGNEASPNDTAGSIFALFNSDTATASGQWIFSATDPGVFVSFQIQLGGTGALGYPMFQWIDGSPIRNYQIRSNASVVDGNWHTIAVTQTGAAGGCKLYVDGVRKTGGDITETLVGAADGSEWTVTTPALEVYRIGARTDGVGDFDGRIAHVAYWGGTVLTDEQIANLHTAATTDSL